MAPPMAEDVRRRRAERVKQHRVKGALPKYGKYVLIAIIVVAAVAAAATFYKPAPARKFAHEHPSYAIIIEGQEVSFSNQAYDITQISDKVHIHYRGGPTDGNTWHVEAGFPNGIPDLTLNQIFAYYGVSFTQGYLKLDTRDGHNGSEWRDTGNKTWRVFVSKMTADPQSEENIRGPWEELTGDYTQHVPRDLHKILVTYGDLSPQEVQRQQGLVPDARP